MVVAVGEVVGGRPVAEVGVAGLPDPVKSEIVVAWIVLVVAGAFEVLWASLLDRTICASAGSTA